MSGESIWELLGLEATQDVAAIKRAYAQRLKDNRPEDDPQGFLRLRAAYEYALALSDAMQSGSAVQIVTCDPALAARDPHETGEIIRVRFDTGTPAPPPPTAPLPARQEQEEGLPPLPTRSMGPVTLILSEEQLKKALDEDIEEVSPEDSELMIGGQPAPQREASPLPSALMALRLALNPASGAQREQLLELLSRVLELLPTGNVMEQTDAETELAWLLAGTTPRSDVLLERCIRTLGWERHEKDLEPDLVMLGVLDRWHAHTLALLVCGQDPDSDAFKRLYKPANPVRRYLRAYFSFDKTPPELRLLQRMRRDHPVFVGQLHPGEVRWWDRFAAPPARVRRRIQPWLYWVVGISAVLKLFVALFSR